MFERFGRSRRPAPSSRATELDVDVGGTAAVDVTPPAGDPARESGGTLEPAGGDALAPLPEQPVPLPPANGSRRARVGVVLPARRSLVPSLALPRVPKRAILAAGVCAGLAAPAITRHLASRALVGMLGSGRALPLETATIEIIRVSYAGGKPGQAAATVSKLLEAITK